MPTSNPTHSTVPQLHPPRSLRACSSIAAAPGFLDGGLECPVILSPRGSCSAQPLHEHESPQKQDPWGRTGAMNEVEASGGGGAGIEEASLEILCRSAFAGSAHSSAWPSHSLPRRTRARLDAFRASSLRTASLPVLSTVIALMRGPSLGSHWEQLPFPRIMGAPTRAMPVDARPARILDALDGGHARRAREGASRPQYFDEPISLD